MELSAILKDFITNRKEICFNNESYTYMEATYKYENIQCIKYFILDFTCEVKYQEIDWRNKEVFQEFQTLLLEDEFFHSCGDARYNLYLVFIVNQDDELLDNIDIQQDFMYARKVVLTVHEVNGFFVDSFPLKRENAMTDLDTSDSKEIMKKLSSRKDDAGKISAMVLPYWFAVNRKSGGKIDKLLNSIKPVLQMMDELEEMMPQMQKDRKRSFKQKKSYYEDSNVRQITEITINNYRKYQRKYSIPFRRVNLLCGDNGMGKTSLLEAIELGITGGNRTFYGMRKPEGYIEVKCLTDQHEICEFTSKKSDYSLAKAWYGADATDAEGFNRFFSQYNYFDTSWASVFAIEGEGRVNINQLKEFLNIEDMEKCKELLHELYTKMLEIALKNEKQIDKLMRKESGRINRIGKEFERKKGMDSILPSLDEIKKKNDAAITSCKSQIERLKEIEIITLDNILKTHISKMKRIFKLLICSNEYSDLQLNAEEIVAIRNVNKENCKEEKVSMSQMSTGQKVCLALAFMFSLFLSNENAPNIIMLDEPVANLDDLHMLNLIDVLRRFAMAGTQIFFTTSNPNVAKLFRRKFSYLGEDFGVYRVSEMEDKVKITYERYDMSKEEPVEKVEL